MAEKPENKAGPKQDDLIAKLVKDPKAPPDALLLSGFVGASSEEGHTRLYFTLEDYVEIPNDAILLAQEIPKEHSPLGGTLLWIKSDAELIHGKVGPNRLKAKFLEGRIQQEFVRAQAAGAAGGPLPPRTLPDGPGCPTQFGPQCPTLAPGFCPSHVPIGCPTNPAACTHIGVQCPTHHPPCTQFGAGCPTHQPTCHTCAGPGCGFTHLPPCPLTHQPPCTHSGPPCPTFGPTILQCCQPSLVIPCPTHHPPCTVSGPGCHTAGATIPLACCQIETVHQNICTRFGPECPIHSIVQPCPPHTIAPPCPVQSGFICGGFGGSAACQPGGPVQVGPVQAAAHFAAGQPFQPSVQCLTVQACSIAGNCPTTDGACTVVGLNCPSQQGICTAVDPNCVMPTQQFPCPPTPFCPPTQTPACPTHHVACTVDIRACINTVNPQQCPIQSAFCPTPACPTHHVIACTTGGPACGVTGPQCPVQSAFCPPSAFVPCLTQQPICRPSVIHPCPSIPVVHCPLPTVHHLPCGPSVLQICPTLRLDCLPSQFPHLCPSVPRELCPVASGGFGCGLPGPGPQGPGPIAGGVANAAAFGAGAGVPAPALHLTSPVICQPVPTLFCPQTQQFLQCHPTILCHTQQIICLQVTQLGCPFPSQFCPSAFCPSGPACGGGGFGGFGGLGQ
jgi:hypothetical protein